MVFLKFFEKVDFFYYLEGEDRLNNNWYEFLFNLLCLYKKKVPKTSWIKCLELTIKLFKTDYNVGFT